ncbi:MAG: peptide deformylase [Thermoleophilia bacterium]|nr:peptide deformylase [Thermoleophilia bacterium]
MSRDAIRVFGDPVLKQESREVREFGHDLESLTARMLEIMERSEGVGLAAPQIGIQRKIMVWKHPETEEPFTLINPRIIQRSAETVTATEGCLSLPGHSVEVVRAERVVVEAMDLQGKPVTLEATGFLARILQHEIDHLEGHLILDRADPEERKRVLKEIREKLEP